MSTLLVENGDKVDVSGNKVANKIACFRRQCRRFGNKCGQAFMPRFML